MKEDLRLLEAILFTSEKPLGYRELLGYFSHLNEDEFHQLADKLAKKFDGHGVELRQIDKGYMFTTTLDLKDRLTLMREEPKKLTRAAGETLAIIAYHQPITRAEIEEIRGVSVSKGTLDHLLEAQWITPKGRRRAPGKPVTWGTTGTFMTYFGLQSLSDLPGIDELKATGLLDKRNYGIAMRDEELENELVFAKNEDEIDDEDDGFYPSLEFEDNELEENEFEDEKENE